MAIGITMTEGAPWKHIIRFTLPVFFGAVLQQLYNTADAIIVGNYSGEASLAAVGTTATFTFLFLAMAVGFSAGNGVVVAQAYGANDEQQVRANASTGILLLLGMGLISTIIGISVSRTAYTNFVGVPPELLELTLEYFNICMLGIVFQFGYNIFSSILRAVGDSAATLYFLLITSILNIGLDLLFVAHFKWGVAGAAWATNISQAVSFVAAYIYMSKKYPVFRFKLRDYSWKGNLAWLTIKMGFPIALQLSIVAVGLTFIQRAVNSFGKEMTASFTVGQRMELFLNLPFHAFQTTLATYAGQNIGAGKMDRVKLGMKQALSMSLASTIFISILVCVYDLSIIHLFGLSSQAAVYCKDHINTIAFTNLILSVYVPVFGVFQGANHTAFPTLVATCALTTRVVVTYLFKDSPYFGYSIIWWNNLFGFSVGFIITWIYYFSGRWQKNSRIKVD
ncbi:MAG: MATE family efflux transporter [Candidatus Riflebacteria bacterium]|nr:MATE family efflux transporter [Candidatus Riflebacteria bacterium]